ncbi:MAG TPA: 4-hydroxybenzoate octaprenyltransferase, partial [Nitrospiria bacterium]
WIGVSFLFGLSAVFFLLLGQAADLGPFYFLSVAGAVAWFSFQAWHIRRPVSPPVLFSLFKSNVAAGFLILFGIFASFHF